MFCLTHTHSAPSIRQEDADKPGGHLIAEYQQQLVKQALQSVRRGPGQQSERDDRFSLRPM